MHTRGPYTCLCDVKGRWVVEHQVSNRSIVIEDCNSRQSVYIFGCKDSLIQVKGMFLSVPTERVFTKFPAIELATRKFPSCSQHTSLNPHSFPFLFCLCLFILPDSLFVEVLFCHVWLWWVLLSNVYFLGVIRKSEHYCI
jgi:hypothetical protein